MSRINVTINSAMPPDRLDLNLIFFGKEECLPNHSWGPGVRDTYILHHVHSGCGVFHSGHHSYSLSAGQGFLIEPGTIVHYQADELDPWTYSWVAFNGLSAKSFMRRAQLEATQLIYDAPRNPYFESFYDDLLAVHSERSSDVLSQSILYRLIAELISCSETSSEQSKPAPSRDAYINQAIGFIESNYSQKITIQDIAAFVGLDRTYLSSLFKAKYGSSLQSFLVEYRMNRATELLANPELSISDISRSVGYTDPFIFSKMFKKIIGQSPKYFRGN